MKFKKRSTGMTDKEEDNRVVANMNIEGTPWFRPDVSGYKEQDGEMPLQELDKKQLRRIAFNATLAGLVIASVFLIVFFLFIMFCIHIWF